jgi:hypothetical protein
MPKQKKYTAIVVNSQTDARFEVEIAGFNAQGAHRNLIYNGGCEYDRIAGDPNSHFSVRKEDRFNFTKEEIIKMTNQRGVEVFHIKYGFNGMS